MMHYVIDTNVLVVANGQAPQASANCVVNCSSRLREIEQRHAIVIDNQWLILGEYRNNVPDGGQLGVGSAFLKWVLTNRTNPRRCQVVSVTPSIDEGLEEFPNDGALSGFDPADRKFVAVALSHPEKPPIVNAVDADWWHFREPLAVHGIEVDFVCPDAMPDE